MKELTRKEEQILLAVHFLNDNAYLITIREQIKEYTGKYYSVGTIYAPLNRLHIKGFLSSLVERAEDSDSDKPIRYYTLTKKGYKAYSVDRNGNKNRRIKEFDVDAEEILMIPPTAKG